MAPQALAAANAAMQKALGKSAQDLFAEGKDAEQATEPRQPDPEAANAAAKAAEAAAAGTGQVEFDSSPEARLDSEFSTPNNLCGGAERVQFGNLRSLETCRARINAVEIHALVDYMR